MRSTRLGVFGRAMLAVAAGVLLPHAALAADLVRIPSGKQGFALERSPVTVAEFERFARAHRFVTEAERSGSSAVMTFGTGQWRLVAGASWRKPEGPQGPAAEPDHPVTHVSWNDAAAYCAAAGRRLPTEAEWEQAVRANGSDGPVERAGRWRANVWTGVFPVVNDARDGYRTTSPVGAFGAGTLGLTDMAGNVWEWMADAVDATERAQRGGSFLCDGKTCAGFRSTARGHATPESSHMHVGFRCAQSVEDGA